MTDEEQYPAIVTRVRITREESPELYDNIVRTSLRMRSYKVLYLATMFLEFKTELQALRLHIGGTTGTVAPSVADPLSNGLQSEVNKIDETPDVMNECIDNYLEKLEIS